ncbi:hypothetical protein OROGR_017211 [Orobanche gracilis]
MAVSNNLTALLNFIALICSIPFIASGIWLASKPDNECIRWLRWPLVSIGIVFLLVALMGFAGAYWEKESLLGVYLVFMFMLIVLILVLIVLAFAVTRHGGAYDVPGMGFREYRLEGFSSWLRDQVTGNDNWGGIRACLAESKMCPKLAREYVSAVDFFAAHLSPTESGCCKPPSICGFRYSGPTTWIDPSNFAANDDCAIWNNDPKQLCYNCDSCKAGLLGNLRHGWRKTNVILIITMVILIITYIIACIAYKNTQGENK